MSQVFSMDMDMFKDIKHCAGFSSAFSYIHQLPSTYFILYWQKMNSALASEACSARYHLTYPRCLYSAQERLSE